MRAGPFISHLHADNDSTQISAIIINYKHP